MDSNLLTIIITAIAGIGSSSGMWAFLQHKYSQERSARYLLKGITYVTLLNQCMVYINRGSITTSEFGELYRVLYKPYKDLGGNGAADRAFALVKQLPTKGSSIIDDAEAIMKERGKLK